jgi:molecular chaperone DnaJ
LGAEIEIPTLDGYVNYTIPEGTQTGTSFTIRGKGIQQPNNARNRGDLRFRISVEIPVNLNNEQKELLKQFAAKCNDSNHSKKKSFFDKIFKKK